MSKSMINLNGSVVNASNVTVPASREFRDAWDLDGDAITVDMTKAKDLHRDKIREARKVEFAKNDITLQDAMVIGDEVAKTAAVARRDELRNATVDPAIDAATTPEELSAVNPCGLFS